MDLGDLDNLVRELLRSYGRHTPLYHRPAASGLALTPVRGIVIKPVTRPDDMGRCYQTFGVGATAGEVLMVE